MHGYRAIVFKSGRNIKLREEEFPLPYYLKEWSPLKVCLFPQGLPISFHFHLARVTINKVNRKLLSYLHFILMVPLTLQPIPNVFKTGPEIELDRPLVHWFIGRTGWTVTKKSVDPNIYIFYIYKIFCLHNL